MKEVPCSIFGRINLEMNFSELVLTRGFWVVSEVNLIAVVLIEQRIPQFDTE